MTTLLLLICAASGWYMTGVIWTVQGVHYALFRWVGGAQWADYHAQHMRRMTPVVLLPMVLELGSAGWLALFPGSAQGLRGWLGAGAGLALGTWAATGGWSVPLHGRLARGHDEKAIDKLLATNWARTALWTAHAGVMAWVLWERLGRR